VVPFGADFTFARHDLSTVTKQDRQLGEQLAKLHETVASM
jgi:hypothetical protein